MNHETKPNLNATSHAFGHPWMFYPAALWAATLSFIFSKLKLSNPKFKNIIKFSSAAKKFEENLRNKGFFNTKNKNAKRNDEETTAKIPFFSCSK